MIISIMIKNMKTKLFMLPIFLLYMGILPQKVNAISHNNYYSNSVSNYNIKSNNNNFLIRGNYSKKYFIKDYEYIRTRRIRKNNCDNTPIFSLNIDNLNNVGFSHTSSILLSMNPQPIPCFPIKIPKA
jgi:hypothetical protein